MRSFSGLANSVLTVTASGKHIIANAGTAIAGRIFGKAGFERFNSLPTELAHPANVYKLSDCIKAEVTSMCCGDPPVIPPSKASAIFEATRASMRMH